MQSKLLLFDTTFRDGVQGENVEAMELVEILKAIRVIDSLGVQWLELGFASSNEAARRRITEALKLNLKAKVAAFGRTCPTDVQAIQSLGVPVGVLVGKSRLRDANISLRKDGQANLELIKNSVLALVEAGLEVVFDAEHFFQAFFEDDRKYAVNVLTTALEAGASWIVLCDTNGGMTPQKVSQAIKAVKAFVPIERLGVHTHNDRGRAVVNAEAAYQERVRHIQGTISGVGERVGNMCLLELVANLYLDHGDRTFTTEQLQSLTRVYLRVCDAINVNPDSRKPFVGRSAFYTEAGMHQSGEQRDRGSYFHCDPTTFGNSGRVGLTEQSGRANLESKARELGLEITPEQINSLAAAHQKLVDEGANFGVADASFIVFVQRHLGILPDVFKTVALEIREPNIAQVVKVDDDQLYREINLSQATARFRLDSTSKELFDVSDGDGPVNAMDRVAKRALRKYYPTIDDVKLTDFKVHSVDSARGTAANVRVVIDFSDGKKTWTTMSVDDNILRACWKALSDSYIYKLLVNGSDSTDSVEKTETSAVS